MEFIREVIMSEKIDVDELLKKRLAEIIADKQKVSEPISEERQKELGNKLLFLRSIFGENHEFKEGQLVVWKEGLKNRVRPRLQEPAVVIEILKQAVFDTEKDSGTPYFREPLDMIIGVLDEIEENLIFFHVDKRRFQSLLIE